MKLEHVAFIAYEADREICRTLGITLPQWSAATAINKILFRSSVAEFAHLREVSSPPWIHDVESDSGKFRLSMFRCVVEAALTDVIVITPEDVVDATDWLNRYRDAEGEPDTSAEEKTELLNEPDDQGSCMEIAPPPEDED